MPELPEVETIRQKLRRGGPDTPALPGLRLRGGQLLWERTLATPGPADFAPRLAGQTVQDVDRRGKYVIVRLDRDAVLVHLRMTGDLLVEPADAPLGRFHRLILDFEGGWRLAFADARKFGRVWLVADPQEVVQKLGPEPLDEHFTAADLHGLLLRRKRQLKPMLLDQTVLAGMGNIYTDEALHMARLHPLLRSNQVDAAGSERLWTAIRQVLNEGIQRNGTSIDWAYRGGNFQNYLRAYQRTGQACPECGTLIERIVVGQRGTHYCPYCQRI